MSQLFVFITIIRGQTRTYVLLKTIRPCQHEMSFQELGPFVVAAPWIKVDDELRGPILAPDATVTTGNAVVDGSICDPSVKRYRKIQMFYCFGIDPVAVPFPRATVLAGLGMVFVERAIVGSGSVIESTGLSHVLVVRVIRTRTEPIG